MFRITPYGGLKKLLPCSFHLSRLLFVISARIPLSARVPEANPHATHAVSWLLPWLTPAHRQGANPNQSIKVTGSGKTGRGLSGAEAPAHSSPPAAALDNQVKFPRRV